jgi:hypothetical protein
VDVDLVAALNAGHGLSGGDDSHQLMIFTRSRKRASCTSTRVAAPRGPRLDIGEPFGPVGHGNEGSFEVGPRVGRAGDHHMFLVADFIDDTGFESRLALAQPPVDQLDPVMTIGRLSHDEGLRSIDPYDHAACRLPVHRHLPSRHRSASSWLEHAGRLVRAAGSNGR